MISNTAHLEYSSRWDQPSTLTRPNPHHTGHAPSALQGSRPDLRSQSFVDPRHPLLYANQVFMVDESASRHSWPL